MAHHRSSAVTVNEHHHRASGVYHIQANRRAPTTLEASHRPFFSAEHCCGHAVCDIGSEQSSLLSPSFLNADLSFDSTFFKPLVHCLSTLIFPAANLRRLPAMLRTFVTAFLLVPQNIFRKIGTSLNFSKSTMKIISRNPTLRSDNHHRWIAA